MAAPDGDDLDEAAQQERDFFPEGMPKEEAAAFHGSVISGLNMGAGLRGLSTDGALKEAVGTMMGDVTDPHFQATLEATLREMAAGAGDSSAGGGGGADPFADGHLAAGVFSALAAQSGATGADTVAKTLEMLSRLGEEVGPGKPLPPGGGAAAAAAAELPNSDSAQSLEGMSDQLIAKMMGEFEAMGRKEDFGSVTDNMMRQLLSKDIMYVPMRSIAERFPAWLAQHADSLTKDAYENYGRMYQTFQKLVLTYETEPGNFPRILELMQDLQDSGNPPVDIIKDLAPGLELTPDGMPAMMPNMGPGMHEGMGMPGIPAAACAVM